MDLISTYRVSGVQGVVSGLSLNSQGNLLGEQEYRSLIQLLLKKNQFNDALQLCAQILKVSPFDLFFTISAARALLEVGQYKQSIDVLFSLETQFGRNAFLIEFLEHPEFMELRNVYYSTLASSIESLQLFDNVVVEYKKWIALNDSDFNRLALCANYLQKNIYNDVDCNMTVNELLPNILQRLLEVNSASEQVVVGMIADLATSVGDYATAINSLKRSAELGADYSKIQEMLGYLYLSDLKPEIGFEAILTRDMSTKAPSFAQPFNQIFRISNLNQLKTKGFDQIALIFEQGVGDQLLYLQLVKKFFNLIQTETHEGQVPFIHIFCEKKILDIVDLFINQCGIERQSYAISSKVTDSDNFSVDAKIWLADLPFLLGSQVENMIWSSSLQLTKQFKFNSGYIASDRQDVKPRVGINWCGPGRTGTRRKDIPLEAFSNLINSYPMVDFISVQYGDVKEQVNKFNLISDHPLKLEDVDQFNNLNAAFSQIASLDCLITSSSSAAHIAGTLGVPCVVILPYVPLWYWCYSENSQSIIYPSVTLLQRSVANNIEESMALANKWLDTFLTR